MSSVNPVFPASRILKRQNYIHRFDNGLVVLGERMDHSESVAYSLSVPGGAIHDPVGLFALSSLCCELLMRGAGRYDSREIIKAYENLGCEHTESPGQAFTGYSGALLPENLFPALELLAENILCPRFPKEELEPSKAVLLQDVLSVEDDPPRKMMQELAQNFFADPWGRSGVGTKESIAAIRIGDIREFYEKHYRPNGAVLSIAGRIEWEPLIEKLASLFEGWKSKPETPITEIPGGKTYVHIPFESAQTHIGLVYPVVPFSHPDYLLALSGCCVLSDGMSSRFFTELREKRGLCYSVYANYITLKHLGAIACYCGTASERAAESLELLYAELAKLREGITGEELFRIKIRAKTSLVMQQESAGSRSGSIARDWYHLERIRTMEEIEAAVDALTREKINEYLKANPAGPFHMATLGPEEV